LVGLEAALVFRWFDPVVLFGMGCMVSLLGWLGILSMAMIYRIPARPYWDHPHTFVAFVTSGTLLGPLVTGVVLGVGISSPAGASIVDPGIRWLAGIVLATLVIQAGTVYRHLQDLKQRGGEGNLSRQMLLQDYETFFSLRSVLGVGLALLMAVLLWGDLHRPAVLLGIMAVGLVLGCLSEVVGRALFYKVVTPMTMPGAFFLKNKRFETYARETGLAEDVSVGVLAERH
jgi:DMSO reductase anchor subunit